MKHIHRAEFKAIAAVFFLSIAFGACEDRYDYDPDPLAMLWLVGRSYAAGNYNRRTEEKNTLEDLGDGTVRFTMIPSQYQYSYESTPRLQYQVLLRKCAQGFIHNAGSNTCSVDPGLGGTDPNLAKLQYCDTPGNDCNELNGRLNNVGNSEMFNSCAGETTSDLTWRGAYHSTVERLTAHGDFATIYPDLKSQWIFSELAHSTGAAYAFRSDIGEGTRSKTDRSFVLCEYQVSEDFYRY